MASSSETLLIYPNKIKFNIPLYNDLKILFMKYIVKQHYKQFHFRLPQYTKNISSISAHSLTNDNSPGISFNCNE